MAFCSKCGNASAEGALHCTSCGAQMAATGPAVPAYAQPQRAAQPSFLAMLWRSLDLGARVAGIGAIVAAVAFFLPMIEGVNGVNMANGSGEGGGDIAWWFRLILPLVALGLLYFDYNNDLRTKIIVGTAQCGIGAIWGLTVFRIMTGGEYTSGWQFGWYALHFGLLAICVGGFMSVLDHTKRLAGVR